MSGSAKQISLIDDKAAERRLAIGAARLSAKTVKYAK
jgi:hypothetical protein